MRKPLRHLACPAGFVRRRSRPRPGLYNTYRTRPAQIIARAGTNLERDLCLPGAPPAVHTGSNGVCWKKGHILDEGFVLYVGRDQ